MLFLFTRALSWQQVLLAKILLGMAVAVSMPLLAALVLRLTVAAPYQPFVTPVTLLQGAAMVMGYNFVAYLVGLGCSIVLPGWRGEFSHSWAIR